jgi:NTE family protein
MSSGDPKQPRRAFVLGGGGHMGAAEVGMLQALLERELYPDLVVGTSVGALHGAMVAADPSIGSVQKLEIVWKDLAGSAPRRAVLRDATSLLRTRTHMRSVDPFREKAVALLGVSTFEELAVPFQCVAASIERSAEHWFTSGPLVDAILASSAVPGVFPPVEIGGEHFIDGGTVNTIPIDRAVALGAEEVFVLHAGRIDSPLSPPKGLRDVAMVVFEVSRRHRFMRALAEVPEGVTVHVLPTGDPSPPAFNDLSQLRYLDFRTGVTRIANAHKATADYLDEREGLAKQ